MPAKWLDDPRIDPRIKRALGALDMPAQPDATSREQLLVEANTQAAQQMAAAMQAIF